MLAPLSELQTMCWLSFRCVNAGIEAAVAYILA